MDQFLGIPGDDDLHESTEAHGGTSAPNPLVQLDPGLFIWTILTFLILFFVLAKFAWKPLLLALESRENTIKSSLEDAEKAKTELERLNVESEEIMVKARSEAQTIRVEAKSGAEKIKADVMIQAGEDAKKIRDEAQKQIKVEKAKAISEIRQEVVNLTMRVAEKVIRKNLSKEDNQSLIEDSIKHLKGYDA
jgi:F-type H+-transporting ATPase subunit b